MWNESSLPVQAPSKRFSLTKPLFGAIIKDNLSENRGLVFESKYE